MRTRPVGVALALALIATPTLAGENAREPLAWVALSGGSPRLAPMASVERRDGVGPMVPPKPATPRRVVVVLPTNAPRIVRTDQRVTVAIRGSTVRGTASWFCGHGSSCTAGYPGGLYAAAGPALRVGHWRGRSVRVRVSGSTHSVLVTLIDWCACPHRLLDLYSDAFGRLAPLSRGLLKVTVTW